MTLLKNGANPNLQNENGNTALHIILKKYSNPLISNGNKDEYISTIKLLKDSGADVTIKNNAGYSPLDAEKDLTKFLLAKDKVTTNADLPNNSTNNQSVPVSANSLNTSATISLHPESTGMNQEGQEQSSTKKPSINDID